MSETIRVLIVEDSQLVCELLKRFIDGRNGFVVVGFAHDGQEAMKQVMLLEPDVITMDIHMPNVNGLETIRWIMAKRPTPVLVLSAYAFANNMQEAFLAMSFGAVDVMSKEAFNANDPDGPAVEELLERLRLVAGCKVIRRPMISLRPTVEAASLKHPTDSKKSMVAIAASTGGPQALEQILRSLPADFPAGIVIVQHISDGFAQGLVNWLESVSPLSVKLAVNGETIKQGCAYVAPTGTHLYLQASGCFKLDAAPPRNGHRPSADALFESLAVSYGPSGIGVILSGMGSDGAQGLSHLKAIGGLVLAQDEASSIVFGMPKAAIDLGVVDRVLPLDEIAGALKGLVQPMRGA